MWDKTVGEGRCVDMNAAGPPPSVSPCGPFVQGKVRVRGLWRWKGGGVEWKLVCGGGETGVWACVDFGVGCDRYPADRVAARPWPPIPPSGFSVLSALLQVMMVLCPVRSLATKCFQTLVWCCAAVGTAVADTRLGDCSVEAPV